jgi:hypothetical protein
MHGTFKIFDTDGTAIQRWMREQVAPAMDRSLAVVTGRPVKKPPIGLRGKYYPDYSPPRFPKKQNISLPAPVSNRRTRSGGGIQIWVLEEKPKVKYAPIMKHWTIEILPSSEFHKPQFLYHPPWCHPFPRNCAAYACSVHARDKSGRRIRLDVGFSLQTWGMFVGQPDTVYPTTTYVPYRRFRAGGRLEPAIEEDSAWQAEVMGAAVFAAGDQRTVAVTEITLPVAREEPEPDEGSAKPEPSYDGPDSEPEDLVDLSFDMTTTLPWQRSPSPAPRKKKYKRNKRELRRLESHRRKGYKKWHPPPASCLRRDGVEVPIKLGPPHKAERLSPERVTEIALWGILAREEYGYTKALR